MVKRVQKENVWTWDQYAFGDNAPNQNPAGLGTFAYKMRLPGQYKDEETNLNYNYIRDYNPILGRYVESDPMGLTAGISATDRISWTGSSWRLEFQPFHKFPHLWS